MAVKGTKTDLHPLCYEHHLEMKLLAIHPKRNISGLVYACPKPDCLIHYRCPLLGCKASLTNEAHLVAAKYRRRLLKVSAPRTRGKQMIGA